MYVINVDIWNTFQSSLYINTDLHQYFSASCYSNVPLVSYILFFLTTYKHSVCLCPIQSMKQCTCILLSDYISYHACAKPRKLSGHVNVFVLGVLSLPLSMGFSIGFWAVPGGIFFHVQSQGILNA